MRPKPLFYVPFVVILWSPRAATEEYFPLSIGNHWEYDGVGGNQESQDVEDTVLNWGSEVYVIRYHESTSNEGLENYWTNQADGDVELWNFHRTRPTL